jgi:hypothetical protein
LFEESFQDIHSFRMRYFALEEVDVLLNRVGFTDIEIIDRGPNCSRWRGSRPDRPELSTGWQPESVPTGHTKPFHVCHLSRRGEPTRPLT